MLRVEASSTAGAWKCSSPNPIQDRSADGRQAGHRPSDAPPESHNYNDFHRLAFPFGALDDSLNPIGSTKIRLQYMAKFGHMWPILDTRGQYRPIVDKLDSGPRACDAMRMVPGANVLKAARIALGLSPEELAEEAGISRRTLGRVETHPRSPQYLKGAAMVQKALEDRGVEFLKARAKKGEGFRLPLALTDTDSKPAAD